MPAKAKAKVLFVYNSRKAGAAQVARAGREWCRRRGLETTITPRRRIDATGVKLVVAIGGDGTILRVAAAVYPERVPILGVNVGGALGFLSACGPDDLPATLEAFLNEELRQEPRMRLSLVLGDVELTALNDVVLTGPGSYRFTELAVSGERGPILSLAGDGLVVATPTGSTAYNLACGGPLLDPRQEAILLTPLAPHTLRLRPLMLPATESLRVRVHARALVYVDGDRVASLLPGDQVLIRRAPERTLLLYPERGPDFYRRLAKSFGWSL